MKITCNDSMAAISRSPAPDHAKGADVARTLSATLASPKKKGRKKKKTKDMESEVLSYVESSLAMDTDSAAVAASSAISGWPRATPYPSPEHSALGGAQAAPFFPSVSSIVVSGLSSCRTTSSALSSQLEFV